MNRSAWCKSMLLFWAICCLGQAVSASSSALVVRIQRNDYPPEALINGLAGDIPIRVRVEPDGQVRCEVMANEGPEILRKPSCSLVAHRWPFSPALDANGKPESVDIPLVVRWARMSNGPAAKDSADALGFGGATPISPENWLDTLYQERPALAAFQGRDVLIRFIVTTAGRMHNCLVEDRARASFFTEQLCPVLERHALLLPAIDSEGRAIPTRGTIRFTFG
ncbi:energy transducer TonB [Sphingobium sp. TKS]|uniref:energy transducer TonB n=1 Tax=Sphingobium sp. TKS TaxID=1315974 RepID=UPI0007706B74|nr:hypothetical protein K426_20505 [Sphingobium sp. TKS]